MRSSPPSVTGLMLVSAVVQNKARNEITVLRLTNGEGCVQLLRADSDRSALLLERLGRSPHELGIPIDRRHEIMVDAAVRVWRPAPDCGLPTGAEKGRGSST